MFGPNGVNMLKLKLQAERNFNFNFGIEIAAEFGKFPAKNFEFDSIQQVGNLQRRAFIRRRYFSPDDIIFYYYFCSDYNDSTHISLIRNA